MDILRVVLKISTNHSLMETVAVSPNRLGARNLALSNLF